MTKVGDASRKIMYQSLLDNAALDGSCFIHGAWITVFEWINLPGRNASVGTHTIIPNQIHAIVMRHKTSARDTLRFESHHDYVDLQYTVEGDEEIDWLPTRELVPEGLLENDVQFWKPPVTGWSSLHQSAGRFAIFLPNDAHRPGIRSVSTDIHKIVVKVRRTWLMKSTEIPVA